MSWSDPISDMLTRMRNALGAGRDAVQMPHSRMKESIAQLLKREGFIRDYAVENTPRRELKLYLKYVGEGEPVVRGLRRESRPGLRRYVGAGDVPRVLGGQGIAVLSTSSGVLTDADARRRGVGGEVLCSIW